MTKTHFSGKTIFLSLAVTLIMAAGAARLYLPIWLKSYVNEQLNNIEGYNGSVEDIDVHLYRGAYSIDSLKINETGSGITVPFVSIDILDLSIQWRSLLQGRIVSKIQAEKPVINFAVNKSGTHTQTGKNVDWSEQIKKLMPIDINRVDIHEGKIFYRNFSTEPQVNVFINHITGEVTNLRNVAEQNVALPSHIVINGKSIGNGTFHLEGKMNILKEVPDMKLGIKLEHVNLPALNNYFMAFAYLDVKKGDFDLYSELGIMDGNVSGYIKPIARNISLIDLHRDSNPVKLLWESLASVVLEIFSNHTKDQFATEIPLSGRIDNVETGKWAAITGIIHNAFIKAFERGLDGRK